MCLRDYKMKNHSFLYGPFQPTLLKRLVVLGTCIGAEDSRCPDRCLLEGNPDTDNNWLWLTRNKLPTFCVLSPTFLSSSFLYFFTFHCLSLALLSFSLMFSLLFYYHTRAYYFQKSTLVFCFAYLFHSTNIYQWLRANHCSGQFRLI